MSYCVTPGCLNPENPADAQVCSSCGAKLVLVGRYRPVEVLGRGGFGRAFRAIDEQMPSKPFCVIKQFYFQGKDSWGERKAAEMFEQEAVRLEELGGHPQIPKLLAHFTQNRLLYLAQELVEGQTLEQELKDGSHFNENKVRQVLNDLLPVLQFIHENDIIHRDIKPENIIRRQRDRKLVLIDFGIAKVLTESALLQTGTLVGSVDYMPPEQSRGKVFPASDLYSLGATCAELLTRIPPAELFDVEENRWCWREYLPPRKRVSYQLGNVLDKLLQPAVSQRFQSAQAVLEALDPSATPSVGLPQSSSPNPSPKSATAGIAHPTLPKRSANQPANKKPKLISAAGINYRNLRALLVVQRWQAADRETRELLLQASRKTSGAYLSGNDIRRCDCEDWQILDTLWRHYSHEKFGFSVQAKLYHQVGREYPKFCDLVGWPTHKPVTPESGLQFSISAPAGHLPSRLWFGSAEHWRHIEYVSKKFASCGLL